MKPSIAIGSCVKLTRSFQRLQDAIGGGREADVLQEIYRDMPAHNFSSELLAHVTDQVAVIELRDVQWSDWGRPERIVSDLGSLGKRPAFPRECLLPTQADVIAGLYHEKCPVPTPAESNRVG